jgi:putative flippase GtrA
MARDRMVKELAATCRFIRANDWRTIRNAFLRRDTHPFLQFVKYGIAGVAAALAHNGLVLVLTLSLLPAGKGMLIDGQVLDEMTRNRHLLLANTFAWPLGTVVAYLMNTAFVFTPGRHSKLIEAGLFAFVGALGFFPGLLVVDWLAGRLGLPSTLAQLGFILTSVAVNFLCRKFLIFKR